MKITVFTNNQPRHLSLIVDLAIIAEEVYAVIEANTLFPGKVPDFYRRSEIMQRYFAKVISAEEEVFGTARFLPKNVQSLTLKEGDLNMLDIKILKACLQSDEYIVFGASYIKEPLIDFLISQRAYNIHMGTSPYYRGSSCNFWASYDGNYDYVGATIHLLSKGLDSGPMLFHAFPENTDEPFLLGMKAVKSAHQGLIEHLKQGALKNIEAIPQDKSLEIKYTRNTDFTDNVAWDYLNNLPSAQKLLDRLNHRDLSKFIKPYIG